MLYLELENSNYCNSQILISTYKYIMALKWIEFVKKIHAEGKKNNQSYSLKDAMQEASSRKDEWKKGSPSAEPSEKVKKEKKSKKSKGKKAKEESDSDSESDEEDAEEEKPAKKAKKNKKGGSKKSKNNSKKIKNQKSQTPAKIKRVNK